MASFEKDIPGVLLLDSHFLCINGLIDADSLQERRDGRGEMGKAEAPSWSPPCSLRPSGSAVLGPIQVPSPCLCQLDADLSWMPFWDAAGIHQVQLLPGLIYSG